MNNIFLDEFNIDTDVINSSALENAKQLISEGNIDINSDWSFSAADSNKILGDPPDWEEYSKWFLVQDNAQDAETKNRYKYPYGKNDKLYRSALIAIRQRSGQQGFKKLFDDAGELLEMIDVNNDDEEKKKKKDTKNDVFEETYNLLSETIEKTSEGFLSGRAIVTNIGIFTYQDKNTGELIREFRPPEEVLKSSSYNTLRMKPITLLHPEEKTVDSQNIKKVIVGFTGSDVIHDSYAVSVPYLIFDQEAIEKIKNKEITAFSCGYSANVVYEGGNSLGVEYDAIQKDISYNHVSLVPAGRAGDLVKIKIDEKEKNEMKQYIIDNTEFQLDEKVINLIESVQKKIVDAASEKAQLEKEKDIISAERDSLKTLLEKEKNDSAEKIKNILSERNKLISMSIKHDVAIEDADDNIAIKKKIIQKKISNINLDQKSEDYINAYLECIDNHAEIIISKNDNSGKVTPAQIRKEFEDKLYKRG